MAISLVKVFAGSTSYVTDHESNYTAIESEINTLSTTVNGGAFAMPLAMTEIYDRRGIMSDDSYKPVATTLSATAYNLSIAAGGYWSGAEYRRVGTTTLVSMAAMGTATHYVNVPTGGIPTVSASAGADTVWQFDYNSGTNVVSAVALYSGAEILFDGDDYQGMLGTYTQVTDRLASYDTLFTGLLSVAVTTADVTLTTAQAKNVIYKTTGTLTGNRSLIVPQADIVSKVLIVYNTCAGAFTLTVKGTSGTGIVVPAKRIALLYWDGTNVVELSAKVVSIDSQIYDLSYAATTNVDWSNGSVQRVTLTGDVTFALAGAHDGQKCILEVIQDATGSRLVTWGAEVAFGTDITGAVLTTTASKRDFVVFQYDSATAKYYVVDFKKGY